MDSQNYDLIVIGGGIVGAATAYKIQKHHPTLRIALVEKEKEIAQHQTGHNSGVIHSGIYYKPGSYKARLCTTGRKELVAFCAEHGIAHDVCGKVIVATNPSEIPQLEKIFARGLENGIEGIERIGPDRIKEKEPHCTGIDGIWVPVTGIVDFVGVAKKCAELLTTINPNSSVLLGEEVTGITKAGELKTVHTSLRNLRAKHLVFCTGLQSDRMAKKDGVKKLDMQIVGFRGDYYELTDKGKHKVKNLIYPVPNPAFPFLGVHFTRMYNGDIECGPNAVFTFKREGYGKLDFNLWDTFQALGFRGTWALFRKHWRHGLGEYHRAFSKAEFLKQLQRLIPSLEMDDLKPGRSGVRAMALQPDGEMIDDFKIEYAPGSLHVLNAPSPAATAALAIGDEVRQMAEKHFKLVATETPA